MSRDRGDGCKKDWHDYGNGKREDNGGEERNGKGFGYGMPPTAANPNGNPSLICVTHKHTRLSFPFIKLCIYISIN